MVSSTYLGCIKKRQVLKWNISPTASCVFCICFGKEHCNETWCVRTWISYLTRCVRDLRHHWFGHQYWPVFGNIGDLDVLMNRCTFKKTSIPCPRCLDVIIFAQRVNWLYISYIQAYNLFNKFNESSCWLIYTYYTLRSRTDTNTMATYGSTKQV